MAGVPRARGAGHLVVSPGDQGHKSRIAQLRTQGALKLVFSSTSQVLEAIMLNTSGGLTGGDSLRLCLEVDPDSQLTLTTQAAERAYRAQSGQAVVENQVTIGARGRLNWLPQEMILFDGASLRRRLTIDMEPEAEALIVEPVVFGRAAMGEIVEHLAFSDRIAVRRARRPLYLDALTLEGEIQKTLARGAVGRGARAMATVVYVSAQAAGVVDQLRVFIGDTGGASLLAPDVLSVRVLAEDGFELRRALVPVLEMLNGGAVPVSWRL